MKSKTHPTRIQSKFTGSDVLFFVSLCAAILFVYFPAISGGFVWDDDIYLTHHPPISDPWGLLKIWLNPTSSISPYPMVFTTYWLEYRLWGFAPEGYHVVNLMLHAMNAFLVFLILNRLQIHAAHLAAFIFAVHPVNVESVAWITERKDVLSGFFFLIATLSWLRHLNDMSKKSYALALASFALAMLSKTVTCTFPILAVFLSVWHSHGIFRHQLRSLAIKTAPMFLIAFTLGLATVWWEKFNLVGTEKFDFSISQRLLMAGRAPWFYLSKLAWPWPLTLIYQEWPLRTSSLFEWSFSVLCLASLVLIFARGWNRRSSLALASGYFIIVLSPALGFLDYSTMTYGYAFNHFQYLAGIGVITLLVSLASKLFSLHRHPSLQKVAATTLLISLMLLARRHSSHFVSNASLFESNIAINPASWLGWYNVGVTLDEQKKPEAALSYYNESLALNPEHIDSLCNRANALMQIGRIEEAHQDLERALALDPNDFSTHLTLGLLHQTKGNLAESIAQFTRATELRPRNAKGHYNLGYALLKSGEVARAIPSFNRAVQLEPSNAQALNGLGVALVQMGHRENGIVYLERAANLDSSYRSNLERAKFQRH